MGGGCMMVKVTGADVPPAVVTVTLAVPTDATRLAGTFAVRMDPPSGAVTSDVLPQLTVAAEEKCVPLTYSTKAPKPAGSQPGDKEVMAGGAGLMVKGTPDEVPPAVTTVMAAVPAPEIRLAGTTAVIWLQLT